MIDWIQLISHFVTALLNIFPFFFPCSQRMMMRLLRVKGYEVLIAQHGGEALSCLESYSVDLVIMVSFISSFQASAFACN